MTHSYWLGKLDQCLSDGGSGCWLQGSHWTQVRPTLWAWNPHHCQGRPILQTQENDAWMLFNTLDPSTVAFSFFLLWFLSRWAHLLSFPLNLPSFIKAWPEHLFWFEDSSIPLFQGWFASYTWRSLALQEHIPPTWCKWDHLVMLPDQVKNTKWFLIFTLDYFRLKKKTLQLQVQELLL